MSEGWRRVRVWFGSKLAIERCARAGREIRVSTRRRQIHLRHRGKPNARAMKRWKQGAHPFFFDDVIVWPAPAIAPPFPPMFHSPGVASMLDEAWRLVGIRP